MTLATVHPKLRSAFRERLLTLSDPDFAANRVAWEGVTFNPANNTPYFAESFRAGPSRRTSFANGAGSGTVEHIIEASVTLFFPDGSGTLAIERCAGAVMALFAPGVRLTYSGVSAVIRDVERSALYDDGGRIGCAVTASILAFTQS